MIVCAGRNESFPFATTIGVGLVESAMNLTQICLFDKPDYIVFIGSAGSYGKYELFDIVESSTSSNIELSFLEDKSYTPLDNVLKCDKPHLINNTIVNSSNYISTDFELSKEFKQYGIGIENMEFFSVLRVAQEFEIDVKGIFVVTNYTNKNAHKDFLTNHIKAMDKLTNHLVEKKLIVPHGTLSKI